MAYSTYDDVVKEARPIKFGASPKVMTQDDVEDFWIKRADEYIDSKLLSIYNVPLQQIASGIGALEHYPYPVRIISAKLAAAEIIADVMSEVEPNASEHAKTLRERANALLDDVLNFDIRLQGQRRKSKNHFLNPSLQAPEKPQKASKDHLTGQR